MMNDESNNQGILQSAEDNVLHALSYIMTSGGIWKNISIIERAKEVDSFFF